MAANFYERPWFVVFCVLACVFLISMLSRIASGVRQPVARETLQQTDVILKSANKWALMSTQDANPILALMHICYGKAYVASLRRILSDDQIQKAHQIDMCDLEQKMDRMEQDALAKISQQAPALMPSGEFAVRTGWLG